MPAEFTAGPQALGYLYQIRYALLLLISAGREDPECEISIENLDDVAFHRRGEPSELLQFKHHIRSQGSLGDTSTDLWRTLRVWSAGLLNDAYRADKVVFTLVTTSQAPDGSAASKLRPEAVFRDTPGALRILSEVASQHGSQANQPAYSAFRQLSQDRQHALLKAVRVLDGASGIVDLRAHICSELRYSVREDHLALLVERLEGWWADLVVRHLSGTRGTIITHRELDLKLSDIRDQFLDDNLPIDFPRPLEMDETEVSQDERAFVRQLELVRVNPNRIRKAIGDFFRASQQRSRWVRDCLVLPDDLELYEENLVDEWGRGYEAMREVCPAGTTEHKKQEHGRDLFNRTDSSNIRLRPRCTEPFVCRGSYHMLANQLRVGWHRDYLERLSHLAKEEA